MGKAVLISFLNHAAEILPPKGLLLVVGSATAVSRLDEVNKASKQFLVKARKRHKGRRFLHLEKK
jgi:hypothetical protein